MNSNKNHNFCPKKGPRGVISLKSGLGFLYDAPQIKAFRISAHVELPDSMEITFDVLQSCVRQTRVPSTIFLLLLVDVC